MACIPQFACGAIPSQRLAIDRTPDQRKDGIEIPRTRPRKLALRAIKIGTLALSGQCLGHVGDLSLLSSAMTGAQDQNWFFSECGLGPGGSRLTQ